jgi:gas vesicle protein
MNWKSLWQGVVGAVVASLVIGVVTTLFSMNDRGKVNASEIDHIKVSVEKLEEKDKEFEKTLLQISELNAKLAEVNTNVEWMRDIARNSLGNGVDQEAPE